MAINIQPGGNAAACLLLALSCTSSPAYSSDIDTLLPSLYGGDGITLLAANGNPIHFHPGTLIALQAQANQALDVSIPLTSGDSGIVFMYDPVSDEFESTRATQGTLFVERAESLGKGRFSYGINYQHMEFTKLSGTQLDDISVPLFPGLVPDPTGPHLMLDLNADIEIDVLTLFMGLGITDRWDVGLIAPIMDTSVSVLAHATLIEGPVPMPPPTAPVPAALIDNPTTATRASNRGLGDLHLRTKYVLHSGASSTLSATAHLRLSNGDESNMQGLDSTGTFWGLLYTHHRPIGSGTLATHLNVSYETNSGARDQDEVDLMAGFEYSRAVLGQQIGLSFDLIESRETSRKDGLGDRTTDVAVGMRWQPAPSTSQFSYRSNETAALNPTTSPTWDFS